MFSKFQDKWKYWPDVGTRENILLHLLWSMNICRKFNLKIHLLGTMSLNSECRNEANNLITPSVKEKF